MTLKNLLQTAKENFRFYVNLAKDDYESIDYWIACLNGVRRMALDSIGWFGETASKDDLAEAYDILDEAYDQAREDIQYIYKMAVNSND